MGGLVSRLQTVDSGDDFWKIVSDRSFQELEASEKDRATLSSMFYFSPNPNVRRVVTIGTPHRGSRFANDYTRWISHAVIRLPTMLTSSNERLVRANPNIFTHPELLTITTSIDSLAPDSPILPVLLNVRKAPWVGYHNIVGLVPDEGIVGKIAAESDGVVNFASAHVEDVQSEVVVRADHTTVHQHPRATLEVRPHLAENLRDCDWELARVAPGQAPMQSAVEPRLLAPPSSRLPPRHEDDDLAPFPSDCAAAVIGTLKTCQPSPDFPTAAKRRRIDGPSALKTSFNTFTN